MEGGGLGGPREREDWGHCGERSGLGHLEIRDELWALGKAGKTWEEGQGGPVGARLLISRVPDPWKGLGGRKG